MVEGALFCGSGGGATDNDDEIVVCGDAGGEVGGGLGGLRVFAFEELLGTGFGVGEGVEGVF